MQSELPGAFGFRGGEVGEGDALRGYGRARAVNQFGREGPLLAWSGAEAVELVGHAAAEFRVRHREYRP